MWSVIAFFPSIAPTTSRRQCRRRLQRWWRVWSPARTFDESIISCVWVFGLLHCHSKSQWIEEEEDNCCHWRHDWPSLSLFQIGKECWSLGRHSWSYSFQCSLDHFSARWKKWWKRGGKKGPQKASRKMKIEIKGSSIITSRLGGGLGESLKNLIQQSFITG